MTNKLDQEEKIKLAMKNLVLLYHSHLFVLYFAIFKALIKVGAQVEYAINNEEKGNE